MTLAAAEDSIASSQPVSRRAYVVLALLSLLLYAPGVWWGVPRAHSSQTVDSWGVDDESPLGPLAEVHNILDPKPDRNLGYPLMYSLTAATAYSPYLGYLWATGRFASPSGVYPYGLRDPATSLAVLGLIAHTVTLLLAVAGVLAIYDAGRVAWGARAGVVGALFALLCYPMFYYARTGNVDVPMLAFLALAFAAFARAVVRGLTPRRALVLGAAAGFALATKEAALGALLPMPVVLLARQWHVAGGPRSRHFWRTPLIALASAVIAFWVGSGLFIEPARYLAHVRFLTGRIDQLSVAGAIVAPTYPYTPHDSLRLGGAMLRLLVVVLTLPGLLLAMAGVVLSANRRERAVLALPAVSYVAWIFLTLRAPQVRYMLPVGFLLACFAGYATVSSWRSSRRSVRFAVAAVAVGALCVGLLRGIDLTWQMLRDSRYDASKWLAARLNTGDHVAFFGPSQKLPHLPPGVRAVRSARYAGMYVRARTDSAQVREILRVWTDSQPRYILILPDHTSPPGVEHSESLPPMLFRALMETRVGYRHVAMFQTSPLFPWLRTPSLDYPTVNPPIRIFAPSGPAVAR